MDISQRDARKLFLKQQGLLRRSEFGRGKKAALAAVKRLSYLQIDTISVVNRAHEHVLASRVENFTPRMLDKLQDERRLFEYWSHAAAYLPFEHYRYSLPMMKGFATSREFDHKLNTAILERIHSEGSLSSKDLRGQAPDYQGRGPVEGPVLHHRGLGHRHDRGPQGSRNRPGLSQSR